MAAKNNPVLSSANKGVTWAYDPQSDKWTAEFKDKKSSSASWETLSDKVQSWLRKDTESKTSVEPTELTLMMLRRPDEHRFGGGGTLDLVPVQLKVGWSAAHNAPRVLKYKVIDKENGGWKQWGAGALCLLDPRNLPAAATDSLRDALLKSALKATHVHAQKALASAWAATKANTSHVVQVSDTGQLNRVPPPSSMSNRSGTWVVSDAWPVTTHNVSDAVAAAWDSADGVWSVPGADIRVRMTHKFDRPEFIVEHAPANAEPQVLFSSSNARKSLAVARATVDSKALEQPALPQWHATARWNEERSGPHWPRPINVHHAIVLSDTTDKSVLVLNEHDATRGAIPRRSSSDEQSARSWRRVDTVDYGGPTQMFAAGPTDTLLAAAESLAVALDERLPKNKARPEPQLTTEGEQAARPKDPMEQASEQTLAGAYASAMDGEELPTIEALNARWEQVHARILSQVTSSEAVTSWAEHCSTVVAQATAQLPSTPAAAQTASPTPRRRP